MCIEALASSAAGGNAWLLVISDTYGGDLMSEESVAARAALAAAPGLNFIFINTKKLSGFYPEDSPQWEPLQRNVDAYLEVVGERGHELEISEHEQLGRPLFLSALEKVMPYERPPISEHEKTHRQVGRNPHPILTQSSPNPHPLLYLILTQPSPNPHPILS